MPEEKVEAVKGMALAADGNGAVFDVPAEDLDLFLSGKCLFYSFFMTVMHGLLKTNYPTYSFLNLVPALLLPHGFS